MNEKLYNLAGCTPTETAVIKLIAASSGGEKLNKSEFDGLDWDAIFKELRAQTAAALPMDVLPEIEELIPSGLFNEWLMYSVQVISFGNRILFAQSELTDLFKENNIPMGILKGAAASSSYPQPTYRNMGDIDFLVDSEDFDRAYRLLLDNGFKLEYDEDHVDYHLTLTKDGLIYELHREPAGIPDSEKGDAIRNAFNEACKKSEIAEIDGYRFYKLPRLQNGLVLLLHMVKHLEEGLGIRQICDWMYFVQKELSDDVWHSEFRPILEECGLETLACIATKMCCLYFGLKGVTWCDSADTKACAELMRFVLDNGNFGHKDRSTVRAGAVVGKANDEKNHPFIAGIFINLQKNGLEQWEAAKKFPFLKCFAWCYLPIRYLGRIITGKRSINYTKHLMETIGKNKSLQDKLAVFK